MSRPTSTSGSIASTTGDPTLAQQSPFERLLGSAFVELPAPVRQVHALREPLQTTGRADVTVAANAIAWTICKVAGLPPSGQDMTVSVLFKPDKNGGEHWERQFGNRRYASLLVTGEGRDRGCLIERFGPFDLQFRLTLRADGLQWSLAGWRLGVLRLPAWTAPRIECFESADGERFTFDIDVTFAVVGWVIHYRGWLMPAHSAD